MTLRLQYGKTAKVFHWTIVALLVAQYLIGWFMPDIHRGMQPGAAMTFHVSVGLVILALIVLRLTLPHSLELIACIAPFFDDPSCRKLSRSVSNTFTRIDPVAWIYRRRRVFSHSIEIL
jgi:hypothetical protein